jgi:hypothetical protein
MAKTQIGSGSIPRPTPLLRSRGVIAGGRGVILDFRVRLIDMRGNERGLDDDQS